MYFCQALKRKNQKNVYCSRVCSKLNTQWQKYPPPTTTQWKKGQKPHNYLGPDQKWIKTRGGNCTSYYIVGGNGHPNSDSRGYIREHRLIMSNHIGRPLRNDEVVHHIDGNGLNNDISNLQLMTKKEHDSYHAKQKSINSKDKIK